ncbi:MAG: four helix bundle protein [Candidatus Omnitrophica bacterium]|nr:four helix bundle protein [Candidatus Omnitrophota bacterium]
MIEKKKFDIYDRIFKFSARTVKFLEKLPKSISAREYSRQLIRSSGSMGSNLEAADGALTKKDFINKVGISRREARESRHWLKLLKAVVPIQNISDKKELDWLINECHEILLILSSIIKKTQKGS